MAYIVACTQVLKTLVENPSIRSSAFTVFGPFDYAEASDQKDRHDKECENNHLIIQLERG